MYIIEGNLWISFQFFHLDKLLINQLIIFEVLCKMKYGLLYYLYRKWGGLVAKKLDSILRVQGSNYTNEMWFNQHGNNGQIFLYIPRLFKLHDYLGEPK
jgi:hypothetical protein